MIGVLSTTPGQGYLYKFYEGWNWNPVGLHIVVRPWQACCTVKPESVDRSKISDSICLETVTIYFWFVIKSYKKLNQDFELRPETTNLVNMDILPDFFAVVNLHRTKTKANIPGRKNQRECQGRELETLYMDCCNPRATSGRVPQEQCRAAKDHWWRAWLPFIITSCYFWFRWTIIFLYLTYSWPFQMVFCCSKSIESKAEPTLTIFLFWAHIWYLF